MKRLKGHFTTIYDFLMEPDNAPEFPANGMVRVTTDAEWVIETPAPGIDTVGSEINVSIINFIEYFKPHKRANFTMKLTDMVAFYTKYATVPLIAVNLEWYRQDGMIYTSVAHPVSGSIMFDDEFKLFIQWSAVLGRVDDTGSDFDYERSAADWRRRAIEDGMHVNQPIILQSKY